MPTEPTNLRLDADTKLEAYAVFDAIGIKPTQAFNLFLRQVVLQKGLPFDVKIPNVETVTSLNQMQNKEGQHFRNASDMFSAWDDE